MLLLEGTKSSDVYYALSRVKDILQRERWARRYGWSSIVSVLPDDDLLPRAAGIGVVAAGALNVLRGHHGGNSHALRLAARELNAAGAVVLEVGTPLAEEKLVKSIGRVDPNAGNLDAQLTEALRYWGAHLDRAVTVRGLNRGGWGALWPRVLLVGERHNGADPAARPFGEDGASSEYLSKMMDEAGLAEREVHFVNAKSATHGDLTWEGVAWLAPRVVLALGEVASHHLRRINVRHYAFPHPQYLRRFARKDHELWVNRFDMVIMPPELGRRQTTPAFEGHAA